MLALLVTVLFARWAGVPGSTKVAAESKDQKTQTVLVFLAMASWTLGVIGFVVSFTSTRKITSATSKFSLEGRAKVVKRDGGSVFGSTPHAIVGCVLFGLAYIITPIIVISRAYIRKRRQTTPRQVDGQGIDEIPTLHHGFGMDVSANSTPGEKAAPFANLNRHNSSVHSPSISTALNNPSLATMLNAHEGGSALEGGGDEEEGDEPLGAGHRERLRARKPTFAPSAFSVFKWPRAWTLSTPKDGNAKSSRRLSSNASAPMLPRTSRGSSSPPIVSHNSSHVPSRAQSRPTTADRKSANTITPASPVAAGNGGESGFVVVNRGRHALDRMTHAMPSNTHGSGERPVMLSDVSWLERRRNMNLVSEMDYAMSRLPSSKRHSTLALMDAAATPDEHHTRHPQRRASTREMEFPMGRVVLLHLAFHALLCALVIYTAVAVFSKTTSERLSAPLGVVFVLLALAYYIG